MRGQMPKKFTADIPVLTLLRATAQRRGRMVVFGHGLTGGQTRHNLERSGENVGDNE